VRISQKITPSLFNNQAEEAAGSYVSILPNSNVVEEGKNPARAGRVIQALFQMTKPDIATPEKAAASDLAGRCPCLSAWTRSIHYSPLTARIDTKLKHWNHGAMVVKPACLSRAT
jgi:hypothetical protein